MAPGPADPATPPRARTPATREARTPSTSASRGSTCAAPATASWCVGHGDHRGGAEQRSSPTHAREASAVPAHRRLLSRRCAPASARRTPVPAVRRLPRSLRLARHEACRDRMSLSRRGRQRHHGLRARATTVPSVRSASCELPSARHTSVPGSGPVRQRRDGPLGPPACRLLLSDVDRRPGRSRSPGRLRRPHRRSASPCPGRRTALPPADGGGRRADLGAAARPAVRHLRLLSRSLLRTGGRPARSGSSRRSSSRAARSAASRAVSTSSAPGRPRRPPPVAGAPRCARACASVQPRQQVVAGQPAQLQQHERVGLDQPGELVEHAPARGGTGRPRRRRCSVVAELAAVGQQLDAGLLGVLDQRVRQVAGQQRGDPAGLGRDHLDQRVARRRVEHRHRAGDGPQAVARPRPRRRSRPASTADPADRPDAGQGPGGAPGRARRTPPPRPRAPTPCPTRWWPGRDRRGGPRMRGCHGAGGAVSDRRRLPRRRVTRSRSSSLLSSVSAASPRAEHRVGQRPLAGEQLGDPLLDRALGDQPVHLHRLGLADPVGAVGGLLLDGGVPPAVEVDDVVGAGQVEAGAAGLERQQEDRDARPPGTAPPSPRARAPACRRAGTGAARPAWPGAPRAAAPSRRTG